MEKRHFCKPLAISLLQGRKKLPSKVWAEMVWENIMTIFVAARRLDTELHAWLHRLRQGVNGNGRIHYGDAPVFVSV